MRISVKEINEKLTKTGPLQRRIIGVYACDVRPAAASPVASVIRNGNPCLAKALFKMSGDRDVPAVCVSEDVAGESCFGLMMWFGYHEFPPRIDLMFTSDSPSRDSFCIKRNSEICTATFRDIGEFSPIGKVVVLQPLDDFDGSLGDPKSIVCFGGADQLRNLGALIHFGESRAFTPIMAPWGSGCSTFVAFPAGMASGCPKDTAFLSPVIPEANGWLPADVFALGIPIAMAARMAGDYESSFAVKKPELTYPAVKEPI
jgi:hypothetical protein